MSRSDNASRSAARVSLARWHRASIKRWRGVSVVWWRRALALPFSTGPFFAVTIGAFALVSCSQSPPTRAPRWRLAADSVTLVPDEGLRDQIFQALDAAELAGTDPTISKFQVRCATVVGPPGNDHVILGGNSEYELPEAIHGETSLVNHAISVLGAPAVRGALRFLAFYGERCSGGRSCGDCRDYLIASTSYERLLIACGQAADHTVHIQRFADGIVPEERLPEATPDRMSITENELARLVEAAARARTGGIDLFTAPGRHLGAAALSFGGKVYAAAGADDAAFHYRTPVGGALQRAATERDYFIKAIAVAGEPGQLPRVSYRDRQYGYEFSSFNRKRGRPPIQLILAVGENRYRAGTFEDALPHAFSTADFMPDALDRFLAARAR